MTILPIKNYDVDYANVWYGNITDEQIQSSLFESDCWDGVDNDNYWCLVTFEDIKNDFNQYYFMTPEEQSEVFGEPLAEGYTVYNWIRDCMMNSLSVVESIKRKEC